MTDYNTEYPQKENRIIIIAGPTAVGKTAAAVRLAKMLDTEIISADSMQVYRGMNIGTAKATAEEMAGVPHNLIDVVDFGEDYNVTRFQEMAAKETERIQKKGKIPVICGGTGFYIQALLYGMKFLEEERDREFREKLFQKAEKEGSRAVWQELEQTDPEYAAAVAPENLLKCIRALEFIHLHGIKFSDYNRQQTKRRENPVYDAKLFVLYDERKTIFEKIDRRVDRMMEQGLLEETEALIRQGARKESTAMQAIGYRQLIEYIGGNKSLPEAIEEIKVLTHRYAKRQIVWFKREPSAIWIHTGLKEPVAEITGYLWPDVRDAFRNSINGEEK